MLLTHPGTQHALKLAAVLHRQGILYRFATGIAFPDTPKAWWWQAAKTLGKEPLLLKRLVPGLPKGKLHIQPLKEALALFRHRVLGQGNDAVFFARNRAFQQQVPQRLIDHADAVIGFDTSSWILAGRCRAAGKPFVLDASIAHPLAKEKVFAALRQQYPAWGAELAPKGPKLIEAELREIELASHIVVASTFTKKTYTDHGVPPGKITVIPYGTELKPAGDGAAKKQRVANGEQVAGAGAPPPVFLFFGSLSARKGFPWLCEVWEGFYWQNPGTRLLAAGYDNRPAGYKVPEGVEVLGPIHPKDRAALFASADVFVFPSYFEGFGQVILEAMACGLPVITTTATAGPDLQGLPGGGIIIEPGDRAGLLQAMEAYAHHPQQRMEAGLAASAAAKGFTWGAYGNRWAGVLEKLTQK